MLCPSCKHENRAGRKFCVHCGAGLELAVVPAMRKLIVACAEFAQLSSMTREAWKTRVDTLAAPPPPRKR